MSCVEGENCDEARKRRRALLILGLMMVIFIVLSGISFLDSRGQVTPAQVSFGEHQALDGKQVFQAYNCMGCHTIVGNGAYFGPDLTKEYQQAGPAWLAAFIPSAGGWPTEAAVRAQLSRSEIAADAGVDNINDYYEKYPGARERTTRRGGATTLMPNLPLSAAEVGQVIAFLKYTSAMNTEGWPPQVQLAHPEQRHALLNRSHASAMNVAVNATAASGSAPASEAAPAPSDPAIRGAQLTQEYACGACHALDETRLVGPGWGGLYGSTVKLADGSTVPADDEYLAESITAPDAKVVAGFDAGLMPSYAQLLSSEEVAAIVAYIHTLEMR